MSERDLIDTMLMASFFIFPILFMFGVWCGTQIQNDDNNLRVHTLNELCSEMKGEQYMFDYVARDYDNGLVDETVVCKLRPESSPLFASSEGECSG